MVGPVMAVNDFPRYFHGTCRHLRGNIKKFHRMVWYRLVNFTSLGLVSGLCFLSGVGGLDERQATKERNYGTLREAALSWTCCCHIQETNLFTRRGNEILNTMQN